MTLKIQGVKLRVSGLACKVSCIGSLKNLGLVVFSNLGFRVSSLGGWGVQGLTSESHYKKV